MTLIAAYGFGARALRLDVAPSILIALGALQVAAGIVMVSRTRALRTLILRHPGFFVLFTLGGSVGVLSFGGSNSDVLFITSAMAWLFPAGYVLQGRRWLMGTAVATAIPAAVWVIVDGGKGGYDGRGHYLAAFIELGSAVAVGLWLGRTAGATSATLNRWYLVEAHERGLIGRLRECLNVVDRRVAAVAAMVSHESSADEITALRSRLRIGAGLSADQATQTVADALAELAAEHADAGCGPSLDIAGESRVLRTELTAAVAQALLAVIRRQLTNVVRHAPDAQMITLAVDYAAGVLRVRVEDDGGGGVPFRAGTGTAWSMRQLARLDGTARYYAADTGVGFEICLPVEARPSISATPGTSIGESLDLFGLRMILGIRVAGWIGDSLGASAAADDIGARWLLMPVGAIAIEYVLQRGIPGFVVTREARTMTASVLIVGLTAIFTIPADSPLILVTATGSAVILSQLIWERRGRWWFGFEFLRALAVAPLVYRHGAATIELVVLYPLGFAYSVHMLRRFVDRAADLEITVADAVGRATLASAAVSGLSLRHDAVDVVLRSGVTDAAMRQAIAGLDDSLAELHTLIEDSLDPREVMLTGIEAALARPVRMGDQTQPAFDVNDRRPVAGAVDGITLMELAALAADERATCAPLGILGRRRLDTLSMQWSRSADRHVTECHLTAVPSLRAPDDHALKRLQSVAQTLGIDVVSTPEVLTLSLRQQ